MDFATVIGLTGSMVLVVGAICLGPSGFRALLGFFDLISVVMVIGGATLTVCTSLPFAQVKKFFRAYSKSIFVTPTDLRPLVATLVDFALTARRDGILALENRIDANTDPFIATGIRMAVDGTEPELIEKLMLAEVESLADRHRKNRSVCDLYGKYAPAYGMIGTLVGLVMMLQAMDDPSKIGPGMAVALLTTLYGAILANVVFLPVSDKLAFYTREEMIARMLVIHGVMAIQSGDNPRVVEQKLNVFLSPNQRTSSSQG